MKRKIKSTAIYFMIVVTATASASISAAASPPPQPGWRQDERDESTVLSYLCPALKAADKAGRLYYVVPCNTNDGYPVPFPEVRVRAPSKDNKGLDAVREIFRSDKRVTVSEEPDGIIRVNVGRVPAAILQTRISLVTLKPLERYTATLAVLAIKNTKEVQAAMRKLGLQEPPTVYSIALHQPMKGKPHLPAAMRDVTVDQALDAVARTFGVLIVFGECTSRTGVHFLRLYTVFL